MNLFLQFLGGPRADDVGAEGQGVENRGPRKRAEGRGSKNTNTLLKILKRTFNNPYITKLLIRKTGDILPDNYILANNRVINLEKQLDLNKKRFE